MTVTASTSRPLTRNVRPRNDDISQGIHEMLEATTVSTWMPSSVPQQRTLSLPSPTLVSSHTGKRKFDSSMQAVPEEENVCPNDLQPHGDLAADSASGGDCASEVMDWQHELRHPDGQDPARLAMELEHVKQMHEQDKQFFTKEIRNLRMLLFEAESNLQIRTDELEYILKERESEKWEWEATREREREELQGGYRAVRDKLDSKKKEYADVLDVLEETQKELLGVWETERRYSLGTRRSSQGEIEAGTPDSRESGRTPESSSVGKTSSSAGRYASIPSRVASLRKRVLENEERFQTAYSAWSNENKYLRKLHQTQLKSLNDELRKSREEVQTLTAENRKLSIQASSLKESLALSKQQSLSSRRSQEVHLPSSLSTMATVKDRMSVESVMKLVQKLNVRIVDAAILLVKGLSSAIEDDGRAKPVMSSNPDYSAAIHEAVWLLGGESLTSRLSFVPSPSSSKDNVVLRTLVQIALTTWSAFHVHSWDLHSDAETNNVSSAPQSSDSPLSAVHRKLRIVEDQSVAGRWRSLARAQIRFSSAAWTQALTSSILSLFTFLGLSYTNPISTMAQELQPLLSSIRAVREAVGELIVSRELEVVTVKAGTRFNSRGMKDATGAHVKIPSHPSSHSSPTRSPTRRTPEAVIATCGLGLKVFDGEEGGRFLALPQVIRERSFRELMVAMV